MLKLITLVVLAGIANNVLMISRFTSRVFIGELSRSFTHLKYSLLHKSEKLCSPISLILSIFSACTSSTGMPKLKSNNQSGDNCVLKGLVKSLEIVARSLSHILSLFTIPATRFNSPVTSV